MTPPSTEVAEGMVARGHSAMMLATFLIATSFHVGAAITHGLDTLVLTFLRFTLAALFFAPIVKVAHGLPLPGIKDLARYSVLGALMVGFFWAMFAALRLTSTLNTATIFALIPAVGAFLSFVFLGERLRGPAKIALPFGLIGAVWVVFRGDVQALLSLRLGLGDFIFFCGSVSLAAYGVMVKLLHRGEPMVQMTFWTLATGAIWLLLLATPRFGSVDWSAVPPTVFAGILYLAIFTTLITFFSVQWSTAVIGPIKVMSYTYLNPALVLLIGIAIGSEVPPLITYPGIALTIFATIVLQRSRTST